MTTRRPSGPDLPPIRVGQPLVGGGARGRGTGGGPSLPGAPPLPTAGVMRFTEEYFPTEMATDFGVQGINVGQTSGADTLIAGATFTLPRSERGVIRSVTFGVGNMTSSADIRFRIVVNGMRLPYWGDLFIPPQPAAFVAYNSGPEETCIPVPPGATVAVFAQIIAGGPYDMSCVLHGWHWGN